MEHTTVDYLADRGYSGDPIYLTDMGICLPADALSPEARKGRWRTMPYETASLSGTLLTAGPETSAPDITYPSMRPAPTLSPSVSWQTTGRPWQYGYD